VTIAHRLGRPPTLAQIGITPLGDWGAATKFWVGEPTADEFTIHVDRDPGRDLDFSWYVDATGH
jgi:hypothetical protein